MVPAMDHGFTALAPMTAEVWLPYVINELGVDPARFCAIARPAGAP